MASRRLSHKQAYRLNSLYFDRIVDCYGKKTMKHATEGPRVVAVALQSKAFIDNGGFFHLFEVGLVDDLGYDALHEAYVAIGARKTAALIEVATRLFPKNPEDFTPKYDVREVYWRSTSESEWDERDSRFYALTGEGREEDIEVLVAEYIRQNPNLFEHLPPTKTDPNKDSLN